MLNAAHFMKLTNTKALFNKEIYVLNKSITSMLKLTRTRLSLSRVNALTYFNVF